PRGVEKDAQAIETLLAALKQADGRSPTFIYTSGVWVIGGPPRRADEDAPIEPAEHVAWRPEHERKVLAAGQNGVRTIVVRPGVVYGGSARRRPSLPQGPR